MLMQALPPHTHGTLFHLEVVFLVVCIVYRTSRSQSREPGFESSCYHFKALVILFIPCCVWGAVDPGSIAVRMSDSIETTRVRILLLSF